MGTNCIWIFVIPWTIVCKRQCPCDFLGKNTGVGCHFLLQGIFLTQRWNYLLLGSGFFTTELYMDIRDLFFFSFRDTNVLIFVTDETLSKGNKSY